MSIGFNYHNSLKVPTSRFSIFNTSQTQSLKGYQQMTNLHSMYTQKKGETWQIQKFEYIWNFQFKIKCLSTSKHDNDFRIQISILHHNSPFANCNLQL